VPVADDPADNGAVAKPAPAAFTANARLVVGDIAQADHLRGLRQRRHGMEIRFNVRKYAHNNGYVHSGEVLAHGHQIQIQF